MYNLHADNQLGFQPKQPVNVYSCMFKQAQMLIHINLEVKPGVSTSSPTFAQMCLVSVPVG